MLDGQGSFSAKAIAMTGMEMLTVLHANDEGRINPLTGRRLSVANVVSVLLGFGGIGLIGVYVSVPIAAVLYGVVYFALALIRLDLALLLMFASAPFPWDLGGGPVKMALAEIDLAIALPVLLGRLLQGKGMIARNPLKWPLVAYSGVCVLSSVLGGVEKDGVVSMAQMAIYLLLAVFLFSSCIDQVGFFYTAFYGFLLSNTFLAICGIVTRQEYLFGLHKNGIGTNLSYAVLICTELWMRETRRARKRLLAAVLCVLTGGLLFSMSRGGWMGTMAGLLVIAALRREFKLLLRGAVLMSVVIAILWNFVPENEQSYAFDLNAKAYNVNARLVSIQYAMHYFETSPLLGVGVGLRKQYDATNVVMSTLAETGVLGLATFLSIFLVFGLTVWKARRLIPLQSPLFSLLVIGAALSLNQFVHGCVDHYWNRVLLPVWGGVGMSLFAIQRWRTMAAAGSFAQEGAAESGLSFANYEGAR